MGTVLATVGIIGLIAAGVFVVGIALVILAIFANGFNR